MTDKQKIEAEVRARYVEQYFRATNGRSRGFGVKAPNFADMLAEAARDEARAELETLSARDAEFLRECGIRV